MRTFEPPSNKNVGLNRFETIICFGDSLIREFAEASKSLRLEHQRTVYKENIRRRFLTSTVASLLQSLEEWHGVDLRRQRQRTIHTNSTSNTVTNATVALILGSSAWDLLTRETNQGPFFEDHLEAVRQFVSTVQERYPEAALFWKAPAALVSCVGVAAAR